MTAPPMARRMSSYTPPEGKLDPMDFELPASVITVSGTSRLWVVGMNGSDLSMRALRLGAFLMSPSYKNHDTILAINIVKTDAPEGDDVTLFGKCNEAVRSCGAIPERVLTCKTIRLPEGWTPGDALVYYSNHISPPCGGETRLVIGAQGNDDKGSASKLGDIALQCLAKAKVPVVLVKEGWKHLAHGEQGKLSRKKRMGNNDEDGIKVVCAVDGTEIGELAFDTAVSMCREGDVLHAVHVKTDSEVSAKAERFFQGECAKVQASKKLQECVFKTVDPAVGGLTVSEALIDASYEADLMILGTVELNTIKKRHLLGSVPLNIAKGSGAHMVVVKRYPHA